MTTMNAISALLSTSLAFQAAPGAGGQWFSFIPLLGIFAIFYVLVFLPTRKKQKDFQRLVDALKKGDKVVTTGGLYGEVVSVDSATVILRIADNVKVKVAKSAIAALVEPEGDKGDNR